MVVDRLWMGRRAFRDLRQLLSVELEKFLSTFEANFSLILSCKPIAISSPFYGQKKDEFVLEII